MSAPLLQIRGLVKDYGSTGALGLGGPGVRALHGIDLDLATGESLAVVGESGCGKSTLARLIMALDRPSAGTVAIDGTDIAGMGGRALRRLRPAFQMIFQDPYGALDPRQSVGRIVAEPLAALAPPPRGPDRRGRVQAALESVGLKPGDAARYPHEFSGGQRQRIAIARALITEPRLIVADEPVSALDVSVQAQILNLLMDLRAQRSVSFVFISHDLSVVRLVADRVVVMYAGRIVEQGPTAAIFTAPRHPYTALLLSAIPRPDPRRRRRAGGEPPRETPAGVPARGCPFAPRCARASARCRAADPPLEPAAGRHQVACYHPLEASPPQEAAGGFR